jgi:putative FmdB family regulatory protein
MPTYEYQCQACKHLWELFQSMTSGPAKKCPKCGKPKAKRLLSAGAGLLFKGSGFYTTDYRSSSYKKAADADKPSTPAPAASASADSSGKSDKPKTGKTTKKKE